MRSRPMASALIVLTTVAALALAGCGASKTPAASPEDPATTSAPAPTVTPPATKVPTAPTQKPTQTEGNGDGEGDDQPATAGGGICAKLSANEVGAVLGGSVTGAGISGGGCVFNQKSSRAPAASFVQTAYSEANGGMDAAKTSATSAVEGEPEDLTGIGDAAFVVTGTEFGGTDIQGAGAVRIGNLLIEVSLNQGIGVARVKVRTLVINLLKLAVAQAR